MYLALATQCIVHLVHNVSSTYDKIYRALTTQCIEHLLYQVSCTYYTMYRALTLLCIVHLLHNISCTYDTMFTVYHPVLKLSIDKVCHRANDNVADVGLSVRMAV